MIDWNSPQWGNAGSNVHESERGSWLPERDGGEES